MKIILNYFLKNVYQIIKIEKHKKIEELFKSNYFGDLKYPL